MWINKYIGIPFSEKAKGTFKEADCYGIVELIYKEELNIEIYKHTSAARSAKNVMLEYAMESKSNWIKVEKPKEFDVIAMAHDISHPNIIQHFGIYIGNNKILQTLEGKNSHIVDFEQYKYCIKAIHRHKEMI